MSTNLFTKLLGAKRPPEALPKEQTENVYGRQLTDGEIESGEHRQFVGGMWEEIGSLQFEFLKKAGLAPHHRLMDIGCGCLRGGVLFVPYLEKQRYFGMDINASLIDAGKKELQKLGCLSKEPTLWVSDQFEMAQAGVRFDYALAVSVFTHLYTNHIGLCLKKVKNVLASNGKFYATFFQAPEPLYLEAIEHQPGGMVSYFDRDPFHYSMAEMEALAGFAGLSVKLVGDWGHPRQQQMLCFSVA
jgi:cyclopropane fatty-acyl-phospholipid synthase-like methyltransferase